MPNPALNGNSEPPRQHLINRIVGCSLQCSLNPQRYAVGFPPQSCTSAQRVPGCPAAAMELETSGKAALWGATRERSNPPSQA